MNIYSFVGDDGENIHIDSEALRQWCMMTKPEIFLLPLNYELLKMFERDNVISMERVFELSLDIKKSLEPIIMVKDGTIGENGAPNALLVDGHHRYALHCLGGKKHIEGHFLEVAQWKPFQLHDIPDMTKDQLRAAPITKRDY
jgi:hypothetical protein